MSRKIRTYVNVLRTGVKITELYPVTSPTIQMSAEGNINSSFTGEFVYNPDVNWLTDEIEPILEVDGTPQKCGVFIPTTVNISVNNGIKTVEIEAYDRCWLVYSTTSSEIMHFNAGANYVQTIISLLAQCNIALAIATPSDYELRYDREDWEFGTDYLTIVNQLLDEINYKPLWFNADGYAIIEPEPIIDSTNIARTYDAGNIKDLVIDDSSIEIDLYDAPNVFVCICQNPDGLNSPLISTAINDNPASPLSTVRRGRRISKSYKIDNIASQSALDDYAKLICQDNMLVGERGELTTLIIPKIGVNDIVAVNYPNMNGLFRETGYEMQLDVNGVMTHHIERVVGRVDT